MGRPYLRKRKLHLVIIKDFFKYYVFTVKHEFKNKSIDFSFIIGCIIIILSVQITYIPNEFRFYYYFLYFILFSCFLKILFKTGLTFLKIVITFFPMVVWTLLGNPLKGFGMGVGLFMGFYANIYFESEYGKTMVLIAIINFFAIYLQFSGISDFAYYFNQYESSSVLNRISIFDENFGVPNYTPQFRPSGIFPNPTYVSAYVVLVFSTIVWADNLKKKTVPLILGLICPLLGNTLGLVLALASLPFIFSHIGLRYFFIGYILNFMILMFLTPDVFHYNFNKIEFIESFVGRLDPSNLYTESIVERGPIVLTILAFASIFILWFISQYSGKFSSLIPFSFVFGFPVMVHDISTGMFFMFMVGGVLSRIIIDGQSRINYLKNV